MLPVTILRLVREGLLDRGEELEHLLGLLRVVALVVAPEDGLRLGIDDRGFHGGRADVHSDGEEALVREVAVL